MIPAAKRLAFAVLTLCGAGYPLADAADEPAGRSVYANCGACHMPTGEGVNGMFPPVRNRVADIAMRKGGREYLILVVLNGLSGPIKVDGVTYSGFMQPHRQSLSDEQIAAVLNYIVAELSAPGRDGVEAFSKAEVTAVRNQSIVNSAALLKLRDALEI